MYKALFKKVSFGKCRVVEECIGLLNQGRKMYIHCHDGCSRTGSLVAILLGRLYQLSSADALEYTQAMYDSRDPDIRYTAPECRGKSPGLQDLVQQVNLRIFVLVNHLFCLLWLDLALPLF
jgi:hypothetical protein